MSVTEVVEPDSWSVGLAKELLEGAAHVSREDGRAGAAGEDKFGCRVVRTEEQPLLGLASHVALVEPRIPGDLTEDD